MNQEIASILKQNNLRLTDGRKEVLEVLRKAKYPMALADLEKKLPAMDRITMYRTLQSFREKDLIHVISDTSGISKYMFNDPVRPRHHAHFKCTLCSLFLCMDNALAPVDDYEMPEGFEAKTYSVVIEGLCNKCSL